MKLISFRHAGGDAFGELVGDQVFDLSNDMDVTLMEAIAQGLKGLERGAAYALADIELLPPIPNPGKIFCVGVNYVEHRDETGRSASAYPTIFTRFADTQVAHEKPMVVPKASVQFDYEGELAVIIGKGGRRIAAKDALSHIAGYTCFNDGSIRDWQNHTQQFTPGKNFPGTGGAGPCMVTADEIADPSKLTVITRLNGQEVQHASCSLMIFDIPACIEYISAFTHLSPGDIISTGTPGGVGAKRTPPLWMKAGDIVEVEIEGLGVLRNPIVAEG